MRVIWTKNAINDLENYKQNSKVITNEKIENYIHSLIDYANTLQNFSQLGKFLFKNKNAEIRQLIYHMHKIFYSISNNEIHILHVYHASKNIQKNLK